MHFDSIKHFLYHIEHIDRGQNNTDSCHGSKYDIVFCSKRAVDTVEHHEFPDKCIVSGRAMFAKAMITSKRLMKEIAVRVRSAHLFCEYGTGARSFNHYP